MPPIIAGSTPGSITSASVDGANEVKVPLTLLAPESTAEAREVEKTVGGATNVSGGVLAGAVEGVISEIIVVDSVGGSVIVAVVVVISRHARDSQMQKIGFPVQFCNVLMVRVVDEKAKTTARVQSNCSLP